MWWDRLSGRRDYESDLDKELRFHLDQHTDDLIAQGYSPEEARRMARLEFGGPEQVKEMCRDVRPVRWLVDFVQDVRHGARMLAKRPGFTMIAVLALALGIGVNTAILSMVNGFVLRPLPAADPDHLVAPFWGRTSETRVWGSFSYANYLDLRDRNTSFSSLCAWAPATAGVGSGQGDGAPADVVWGELVTSNYFEVMGVQPLLGRGFLPEEDVTPDTHPVVVLSHSLWQRRFGADPDIVGKLVYLNGLPFTVVGVMPESFLGSAFYLRHAFWAPSMMAGKLGRRPDWNTDRGYSTFRLYGRLKPDVTISQAEADLSRVADEIGRVHPNDAGEAKVQILSELDGRYGDATRILKFGGLLALCVSGLVLLVACANVANLTLARAAARASEIGVRMAIGASRGRIVRQLLTESVMLALLGGGLGWPLAYRAAELIRMAFPPVPVPISFDFTPDGYVLKWMLAISMLTGVIFGLAPALLASRMDLLAVIKGLGGAAARRQRWNLRGGLVVAQLTISIVVLICAGLFIRNLGQIRDTAPGFETENLVTMSISLDLLGYDNEAALRFYPELQRRLIAQPGVRSAALTSSLPLRMDARFLQGPIVKEGESEPPPERQVSVDCAVVTPKYFDAVRTPLVSGREFSESDDADAPRVVIVNQEFARRFYDGDAALGKRFRVASNAPLMEIVGIAADGRYRTLYDDPQPFLFLPVHQQPRKNMTVVISGRAASDVPAVVESARREIAGIDARLPVIGVMVGEENLSAAYLGPRIAAGMATSFGVLALFLATVGLYSVMMYTVSQRTREIGIRMAIGASFGQVVRMIVREGMRMALIGVVLGLAGAFALTRVLASLLLGIGATDPIAFAGVTILLVAVALLACYLPARRAARIDPLVALRYE